MWGNYLSGSRNGFLVGLAMVGAGVGMTIASAILSLAFGWGLSLVFYGLILAGLIRMAVSVPALLFGEGDAGRPRRGRRLMAQPYVAPPSQMPQGLCWMCGGKVRRGNSICLHCGAAQPATARDESETSRLAGYDPNAGDLVTFFPSDGPAPSSPYPPAPYPGANPGGQQRPDRAGQWGVSAPPPAHGSVWRPETDGADGWDDAPAKRSPWRLR